MDGPHTNWSVLERLKTYRDENRLSQIMGIGSCGIHAVHGAFQTVVEATRWELDKVLKAMWKLFNDSPVRRDFYIRLNILDLSPLMFCKTTLIKNESGFLCAIDIW